MSHSDRKTPLAILFDEVASKEETERSIAFAQLVAAAKHAQLKRNALDHAIELIREHDHPNDPEELSAHIISNFPELSDEECEDIAVKALLLVRSAVTMTRTSMSAAKPLTADSIILDGEVYRWDYDGSPRFYHVRIYDHDPRENPSNPHVYIPRVKIFVQLEGDPTAYSDRVVTADGDYLDAVHDCIGSIEELCRAQWDREAEAEKRDCLTSYERQFGY